MKPNYMDKRGWGRLGLGLGLGLKVYQKVYQVALLVQNDCFTVEKSIGRRGVKLWSILSCMGMCQRLEKGQSFWEVEIKCGLSMRNLVGNSGKLSLKKKEKKREDPTPQCRDLRGRDLRDGQWDCLAVFTG